MLSTFKERLAREERGFTLIELLVVIIIIGILLAIAVPSYLSFRDRATQSANKANVRAAVPAVEAYAADNNGTTTDSDANSTTTGYAGMARSELLQIDAGLATDLQVAGVDSAPGDAPTTSAYCIQAGAGSHIFHYSVGNSASGTQGVISAGACD